MFTYHLLFKCRNFPKNGIIFFYNSFFFILSCLKQGKSFLFSVWDGNSRILRVVINFWKSSFNPTSIFIVSLDLNLNSLKVTGPPLSLSSAGWRFSSYFLYIYIFFFHSKYNFLWMKKQSQNRHWTSSFTFLLFIWITSYSPNIVHICS